MSDVPDVPAPPGPPPPEAWFQWHEAGLRGIQETARWMLGVVAAGLLTFVQLSGIGRYGSAERPFWLVVVAAVAVVASMVMLIRSVLRVQPGAGTSFDVRRLSDEDLRYVQEWGFMRDYGSSHERFASLREADRFFMDARNYRPPRLRWLRRAAPVSEVAGYARNVYYGIAAARWDEQNATVLLSYKRVNERFRRAKWEMLIWGVTAMASVLFLTWAANPPEPTALINRVPASAATPVPQQPTR